MPTKLIGIGSENFSIAIYIANRPPLPEYENLQGMHKLSPGEVYAIAQQTGNHWRKIFNVYAKFLDTLGVNKHYDSWQTYRDSALLQTGCKEALLFSRPDLQPPKLGSKNKQGSKHKESSTVHIIAGKTYAENLQLPCSLEWQDAHFAINREYKVIVSPYLDYRQLSNERIMRLVDYVRMMSLSS